MRIRLSSETPALKAWYNVGDLSTISALKNALCADVRTFKDAGVQPAAIELLLDDFELLDESTTDVLHEGDILCIKVTPGLQASSSKRKPPVESASPRKARKVTPAASANRSQVKVATSVALPSSSEDSSDTSSSSSSSSEDDSESEESSSDESGSSDSSSPPHAQPILRAASAVKGITPTIAPRPLSIVPTSTNATNSVQSIPVPPGHGRPQTVKRNERRRRKRIHDLERARSETANMLKGTSAANAVPLGARPEPRQPTSTATTTSTPVPPTANTSYMMSTLSNKNKRRGYKEAPATLTPKIVFGDETNLVASSSTVAITADAPAHELPRLVSPSERQDNGEIPASWRLFVTSVDVEGGMPRRGKKKKQQLAKAWDSQLDHDNNSYDNVQLDYDMADEEAVVSVLPVNDSIETNANAPSLDWARVEQRFSDFAKVSDLDRCVVGTYFTWKALDINPVTFTPEHLLHVACVLKADARSLLVRHLVRPGARPVSFGMAEEDILDDDKELVTLDRLTSEQWRIVV